MQATQRRIANLSRRVEDGTSEAPLPTFQTSRNVAGLADESRPFAKETTSPNGGVSAPRRNHSPEEASPSRDASATPERQESPQRQREVSPERATASRREEVTQRQSRVTAESPRDHQDAELSRNGGEDRYDRLVSADEKKRKIDEGNISSFWSL